MRRRVVACFALAFATCIASSAQTPSAACKTTNLYPPQSAGAIANSVNKYETVVGYSLDESTYQFDAFRWSGGKFLLYDYPGAKSTQFDGTNDAGLIVGFTDTEALTYQNGVVHTFNYPGATSTQALGINNSGTIVGAYPVPGGKLSSGGVAPFNGYIKKGSSYTKLVYPGAYATYARAISDTGAVVGSYFLASGQEHGFLYANGKYQAMNYPGSYSTQIAGINKYGSLVGKYQTSKTASVQGFGYRGGSFYSTGTSVQYYGVNNLGDRVGAASSSSGPSPAILTVCR